MLAAGDLAPDFELPGLDGRAWSLRAALQTGPVLVVFFKIACETCQFTLPFLQKFTATDNLRLIAVSQDDAPDTKAFLEHFQLQLPVVLDKAWEYRVSNAYETSFVPSLFLIETDGRISLTAEGFRRRELEELGARFGVPVFGGGQTIPTFRPG